MSTVLLVVQIFLAVGIIGLVLIQRSDSDGFGMGSGSGFGVLSGRAKANLLTRATAILAGMFMVNSLLLTILTTHSSNSLLDKLPDSETVAEKTAPTEAEKGAVVDAVPVAETTETPAALTEAVPVEKSTVPEDAKPEAEETPAAKEEVPTPVVPRAE